MHKTNILLSVATALSLCCVLHAQQLASKTQATPEGLTAGQWTSIRAAYEAGRHAVSKVDGVYQARNPGQAWLTRFEDGGFEAKPDAGAWTWGLKLKSYGFAGDEQDVGTPSKAHANGGRMSYRWDALLEEWYVNDTRGLEHGYTVQQRPARKTSDTKSPLAFTLAVRGGLSPQITDDKRGVRFVDQSGGTALTYTGLTVFDADGRDVPARFERRGDLLRLLVEEDQARYPLTIDPIAQQAYLKASNTRGFYQFGEALAISGDTVVVGSRSESGASTGVNGNQAFRPSFGGSGAAYVFVRSGSTWSQQAYLKASNTNVNDSFGSSVAVSGDTIVIGARLEQSNATGINGDQSDNSANKAGAAYVFVRNGSTWSQQAYLKASNTDASDEFGSSVSISGDTLVIGADLEDSIATGVNGNQANSTNARQSGAAYVFVRSGSVWSQDAYLKASNTGAGDGFGESVSISGDVLVVGARFEDSNASGVNGDQANNRAGSAGAAYVFARGSTGWGQEAYLKASNTDRSDGFGESVSVSGATVVVGARHEDSGATGVNGNQGDNSASSAGAVYVFVRSGGLWSQEAYLKASNTDAVDLFGMSVSISGDTVVVGAPGEQSNATGVNGNQGDNSLIQAGAAYVFVRKVRVWSQQAYLKASNTDLNDLFGFGKGAASISGDTVVVGAYREDSSATGVNGDQGNLFSNSGAAYVFDLAAPAAEYSSFGKGCASTTLPSAISATTVPKIDTAFTLRVSNLVPPTTGILLFGISDAAWNGVPLPLNLLFLGMNGCSLLVSWDMEVGFSVTTGSVFDLTIPIPNDPTFAGLTFYNQAWVIDRQANAFGVGTSNGGKGVIGY